MSLLGGDGHDHYPSSLLLSKWDFIGSDIVGFDAAYARFTDDPRQRGLRARGGFQTIGQCALGKNLPAAIAGWGFHGLAFRIPVMHSSGYWVPHAVYDIASSGGMKLCTMIGADGSLNIGFVVVNNFSSPYTILKAGNPGRVVAGTWYYLESAFNIKSVSGGAIVRLNAADPIAFPAHIDNDYVSYSGNTVRSSGSNYHADSATEQYTHFRVNGSVDVSGGSVVVDVDDQYWGDDQGSINNDFLGNVRLGLIVEDAVGGDTDMTVVGSGDPNWQVVAQTTPNDAIYVKGDTVAQRDMYGMETIVGTPREIFGLLCNHRVSQDDAETRTYDKMITPPVSGVPVTVSSHTTPSGGFVNQQGVSEVNPDTGVHWLASEVNAAGFEYGQEITT